MLQLKEAADIILRQLTSAVEQITEEDFRKPTPALNASIGQHLRHTLEFFICLHQGFDPGIVNYDKREHNKDIENNKFIALDQLYQVREFIQNSESDRPLKLEVGYQPDSDESVTISSNFLRELVYNIEHAVHHMALMKIGIKEVAPYISLPSEFGIAISTLRYKEALAAAQ